MPNLQTSHSPIADAYNKTLREIDELPEVPFHNSEDAREVLKWSAAGASLYTKNLLNFDIATAHKRVIHEIDELPPLQWDGDSRELMKRVVDAMSMFMAALIAPVSEE